MPESNSSTDSRFVIGRLGRPHGLNGYIGLYAEEADLVYFSKDNTVFISDRPYVVRAIRRADKGFHLKLDGVDTREGAEAIRGNDVVVTERRSLEEDEFWPDELAGLVVVDEHGREIGVVRELAPGTAQDRLVVEVDGAVYEIPFVKDLVPDVDLDGGRVEIRPIPGLVEPPS